jgi:hypothetical protein
VIRADKLAAKIPAAAWQRVSCGPGSKGDRVYDWALADAGPGHDLLIRRSVRSGELAFYRCWAPSRTTLADLVRVAGARWAVEECFAAANETALDHYQVRKHTAWYRHVTLAMCAHAWLAVTTSAARLPPAGPRGEGGPTAVTRRRGGPPACGQPSRPDTPDHQPAAGAELACLTVNEIRRLHAIFSRPAHPARPPALVSLATPPPGPRPALPLPATRGPSRPGRPRPSSRPAALPPR